MKIQKRTPAVNLNSTRKSRLTTIAMNSPLERQETETQQKQAWESSPSCTPAPPNEGQLISQKRRISKNVFQRHSNEMHPHGCDLLLEANSIWMMVWWGRARNVCRHEILRLVEQDLSFLSHTAAAFLPAFVRPWSSPQHGTLLWRNTHVRGGCWFMSSVKKSYLQRNNVSKGTFEKLS